MFCEVRRSARWILLLHVMMCLPLTSLKECAARLGIDRQLQQR